MYTSALFFALAAISPTAEMIPVAPSWRSDYNVALKEGQKIKRPLAIFVGSGPEGWDKISKEGELDKEARELLHHHYVCLYLDTSKDDGRSIIEKLDLSNRTGLVIGDASGQSQAFWHSGSLRNEDLDHYLRKYSDPELVVVRTERSSERVADAQPIYRPAPPIVAPQYYYAPSVSFGGGCRT